MFLVTVYFFSCNASNAIPLKSVLMNNQKCKIKPGIIDINSNEHLLYSYSIQVNKCIGSCNNINDLYLSKFVLDVVKNINIKVFNSMSRTN